MKRQFSFPWLAFATLIALSSCSPSIQSTRTPGSALVKIECYHASVSQILLILRSGRGRDISVTADGPSTLITAAFSPLLTDPARLAQILHDLDALGGVMHVEVMENPRPVMQNF